MAWEREIGASETDIYKPKRTIRLEYLLLVSCKYISDSFHKVFWTLAKRLISVGELTLDVGETTSDVGETTSDVGELVVGELTRWRNDRLPLFNANLAALSRA